MNYFPISFRLKLEELLNFKDTLGIILSQRRKQLFWIHQRKMIANETTLYKPNQFYVLQIVTPGTDMKGYLDGSEFGNWLRFVGSASEPSQQNVQHILLFGSVREKRIMTYTT